jgi:hypothetical protein
MKSIDRFKTFCLFCSESSGWRAKEKEWRDSDGNRLRSSMAFIDGAIGPGGIAVAGSVEMSGECVRDTERDSGAVELPLS